MHWHSKTEREAVRDFHEAPSGSGTHRFFRRRRSKVRRSAEHQQIARVKAESAALLAEARRLLKEAR